MCRELFLAQYNYLQKMLAYSKVQFDTLASKVEYKLNTIFEDEFQIPICFINTFEDFTDICNIYKEKLPIILHNFIIKTFNDFKIEYYDSIMKKLKKNGVKFAKGAFIHSDQGFHYTNPQFQKLVKKMGLEQSMSRRGNCWDNAPQESFFGHMKDEIDLKVCSTLDEVKQEIKSYMTYYNLYRGQWNLKKMTPVQYRNHLLQVV